MEWGGLTTRPLTVNDTVISQLHRAPAKLGAFRLLFFRGGGCAPISLITSPDWLFGCCAAVNTPVRSSTPFLVPPPGGAHFAKPQPVAVTTHGHIMTKAIHILRLYPDTRLVTFTAHLNPLFFYRHVLMFFFFSPEQKVKFFSNLVTFKGGRKGGGALSKTGRFTASGI